MKNIFNTRYIYPQKIKMILVSKNYDFGLASQISKEEGSNGFADDLVQKKWFQRGQIFFLIL